MKPQKKLIPVFVLTIKGSKREKIIKKRLQDLKLKYKIIYGINAKLKKNIKLLRRVYNRQKTLKVLERDLDYSDIACAYGHIKIYKYIVKNKIRNSIIMEDDCYPSSDFRQWVLIKDNFFDQIDFVQFYSNSGLIYKKKYSKINNKFIIHKAKTHLPLLNCYQINIKSCKFLLKYFKEKIFQTSDFPGEYFGKQIKQFFVTPVMAVTDKNHITTSTNKKIWSSVHFFSRLRKFIFFYSLFNALFHISHLLFLFNKKNSYKFYKKQFLDYKIQVLINYFFRNYINLPDLINNKNIYSQDIQSKLN